MDIESLKQLVADIPLPRNEDTLIVSSNETYESPIQTMTLRTYSSIEDQASIAPGFYVFVQAAGRCNGCGLALGHLYVDFCQKVNELFANTPESQQSTLDLDEIFNSLGISRLRYCCRNVLAFPKVYTYNWLDKDKLKKTAIQTLAMKSCPIDILSKHQETDFESLENYEDDEQEFVSRKITAGHAVNTVPTVHELMA